MSVHLRFLPLTPMPETLKEHSSIASNCLVASCWVMLFSGFVNYLQPYTPRIYVGDQSEGHDVSAKEILKQVEGLDGIRSKISRILSARCKSQCEERIEPCLIMVEIQKLKEKHKIERLAFYSDECHIHSPEGSPQNKLERIEDLHDSRSRTFNIIEASCKEQ